MFLEDTAAAAVCISGRPVHGHSYPEGLTVWTLSGRLQVPEQASQRYGCTLYCLSPRVLAPDDQTQGQTTHAVSNQAVALHCDSSSGGGGGWSAKGLPLNYRIPPMNQRQMNCVTLFTIIHEMISSNFLSLHSCISANVWLLYTKATSQMQSASHQQ